MRTDGPTVTAQLGIIFQRCCVTFPGTLVTHSAQNMQQRLQVYIHLAPHPERAQYLQETARTLREAYELVAHEAIAELCERHSAQLGNAPASFLPIRDQADMPWRLRYQENTGVPSRNSCPSSPVWNRHNWGSTGAHCR